MKLVFPEISNVFNTEINKINTLVIENPELFYNILEDIQGQIDGLDGNAVFSQDDKILVTSKYAELHTQFIPFNLNQKNLLTKAAAALEKTAISDENYPKTLELMGSVEKYLLELSLELEGNIYFEKCGIGSIIKSVGLMFEDNEPNLCEKIVDYLELVREYERDKFFIFVNLRSYINDKECALFFETILGHHFNVMLIDCREYAILENEKRYIVDYDLCEIG